jgi:hypothetical protein
MKNKLAKNKGAILVEIEGKTMNLLCTQKQFDTIIEMLYLTGDNKIYISDQEFPTITLLPLSKTPTWIKKN